MPGFLLENLNHLNRLCNVLARPRGHIKLWVNELRIMILYYLGMSKVG